ncbi:MAG: sigma factor-like helix-turn-helix DNA-binding protein [Kineosporiaceae bacterium]
MRAAVVLRFYGGLDDAAVATHLGCREVTVRASISRGLAHLRRALGADLALPVPDRPRPSVPTTVVGGRSTSLPTTTRGDR